MKNKFIILCLSIFVLLQSIYPIYAKENKEQIDYQKWYSNTKITIDDKTNEKSYIIKDEILNQSFLLKKTEKIMYVSANIGLNIRSVPTIDSEPITALPYGSEVKIIGMNKKKTNNQWVLIEYNSKYAFVWSEYLMKEPPTKEEITDYSTTYEQSSSSYGAGGMTYLGNYMCTAYEWTGNPCANGNYPTVGYTVACNSLSLGSQIYIDGYGYYTVEDRGGGGHDWIDIYMGDVGACYDFGVRYLDIYLVN